MLTVVVILAAVVSKMIGCGISALPMGRLEAWRIGVGMIPRGEVGMVVAQIGLSLGAVSRDIYGVVVLMAVATTIVAPPLIAIAYKDAVPSPGPEVARVG